MKKLEIKKTKPTFIMSTFKTDIIKVGLVFSISNFFIAKTSLANNWRSFSSSYLALLQFSTTKLESQQPNRNYATRYIHYTATPMRPAYVQVYVSCWVERQDHGLRTYDGADGQLPNSLQPKTMIQPKIENPEKCIKVLAFCRKNGLSI